MPKGEVCVALVLEKSSWNRYWEGDFFRQNANIGTLKREMLMPMLAFGLTDRINLMASLPYIRTEASAGTLVGQSGIQDLTIGAKIDWLRRPLGHGEFFLLTNAHYSQRAGNYLSDYMPFSIGLGAPEIGLRAITGYQLQNGIRMRLATAYLWRGQTEIERDFYYMDGAVYSAFMTVPDALNIHGAIAYWALENRLRFEATYTLLHCLSGDDIRSFNRPQPTNKMEQSQLGAWVQYQPKLSKGLGFITYFQQVIAGRNVGSSTTLGAGVTYQFKTY